MKSGSPILKSEAESFAAQFLALQMDGNAEIFANSLEGASPLLLYAFKYLNSILRTHKGIEARIFLTKGEHFMFSCTDYESELFEASPEMSSYFNYCKLLFQKFPQETGQFSLDASDNYNITIEPLLCSLRSELGMSANPLFA